MDAAELGLGSTGRNAQAHALDLPAKKTCREACGSVRETPKGLPGSGGPIVERLKAPLTRP
jgi:hypothetical protein